MTIHPYRYCKRCGAAAPFFYDFDNKEWCCFLCGHPIKTPESELPDEGEIRNVKKWNPLL